jgi:uncharacterized membrane protein YdcZ (DUF606 family)
LFKRRGLGYAPDMRIILGVVAALITGTAIAAQSTLNGRTGAIIGPIRTGLAVNALGGAVGAIVILGLLLLARLDIAAHPFAAAKARAGYVFGTLFAAGLLGILIISGISYAVQGVGVTAGLAAVILAQLVVGLIIDSAGGASVGPIPLDLRRVAGIAAMAIGVWLLVPRT